MNTLYGVVKKLILNSNKGLSEKNLNIFLKSLLKYHFRFCLPVGKIQLNLVLDNSF